MKHSRRAPLWVWGAAGLGLIGLLFLAALKIRTGSDFSAGAHPGRPGAPAVPPDLPVAVDPRSAAHARQVREAAAAAEVVAAKPPAPGIVLGNSSLKKTFDQRGMRVKSPAGEIGVSVKDIRIGGLALPPGAMVPRVDPQVNGEDGREEVVYARGAVTEKYQSKDFSVEQIVELGKTLQDYRGAGPLVITVGFETTLEARHVTREAPSPEVPGDLIEFVRSDEGVAFTYQGAVAIDAKGRRRALRYGLRGGVVDMTLDADFLRDAEFPLTVDPLLGSNMQIDFTGGTLDHIPDVAWHPGNQCWLVVYERSVSGTNGDIYCKIIQPNGTISGQAVIDNNAAINSRNPHVARSSGGNWLVVWQEQVSGFYQILGMYVGSTNFSPVPSGTKITISWVTGKDNINPDVGFCTTTGTNFVPFEAVYSATDHDIYAREVQAGGALGGNIYIDTSGNFDIKPTVTPVWQNPMGVAWVKQASAGAQGDIYAVTVDIQALTVSVKTAVSSDARDEDTPELSGSASASTNYVTWNLAYSGTDLDTWAKKITFPPLPLAAPTVGVLFAVNGSTQSTFHPHCQVEKFAGLERVIFTYSLNPTNPPTAGSTDIYAVIADTSTDPPTFVEGPQITSITRDDDNASVAVFAAQMQALVVWDDSYSSTDFDIWGQFVTIAPVPGVTVTPTSGLTTTESGGTAQFTVVLNAAPAAVVTIPVSSSNVNEGTPSVGSLVFTTANWNVPQTVTVTGRDDTVVDGPQPYTIILGAISSTDGNYSGINPPDVSLTNLDNDVAGVIVNPTAGLVTTESGGTATFTVVLTSTPSGNVTIGLSSSNTAEGTVSPTQLVFTPANALTPQTVTVTGVDDFVIDGPQSYTIITAAAVSSDGNYNGLDPADVAVTNNDNDVAGITVTPTSGLVTTEAGGTATFTVKLNTQPSANVTIGISSSNTLEGTVSPGSLVFTSLNWNTAQTVTVTGVDDFVVDGPQPYTIVTAAAVSADTHYNGFNPADVSVTNMDNDVAGIIVNPTTGLVTTEAGGTAQFTVKLSSQPVANVTIGLSSSNTGEGTVAPASLVFTPSNWNTAQTVTVTGVDDAVDDGDKVYTIVTAPATSTDTHYSGMDASDVTVTNLNNDTAGITVSPTSGLVTTEAAGQAFFTIKLNSQPTANVTIGLSSSNTAEGTVSPSSVTFTPLNWSTAQTVTVTGVDDFVADGDQPYTIITAPATSSDLKYNGMNPPDVSVVNQDNDVAGYVVTPTAGLSTTEAGGTAQFTVKLKSQPVANVTINLASSNINEGTVAPASLLFTAANWSTAQTVTVTGVDDFVQDGNVVYTIITTQSTTDPVYAPLDPPDVTLTNLDNDVAGYTVSPTSGLITTEAGGTATFTVKLTSQPTVSVTIPIASNNTAEGTVSTASLTFTTANWNTAQTVTITGVDDAVQDGDKPYTIILSAGTGGDPHYTGLKPPDVSVTNLDNDVAGITVFPTSGLVTTEAGGTATFTIKLNSQPTASVTVPLSSSNTAEGTVQNFVVFTTANWNTAQTVVVTGVDDFVQDGDKPYTINVLPATSTDPKYSGFDAPDVSVTNLDNDVAGFNVFPNSGLVTTESGGTATFTVVLTSQPTANVSFNLLSSNLNEGTVAPGSLTFTTSNWNTAQTVTITGVDDNVIDGNVAYFIGLQAATSTDTHYSGLKPSDVQVTNNDNDVAGFTVFPTAGLITTEAGGTAIFTVKLTSQPSAVVSFNLSSSKPGEGSVSPTSLTFTAGNWNTAQTVTVTGVDDSIADGDQPYTIILGAASSTDTHYSGVKPSDVSVTNQDNDTAGFLVTPTSGLQTTEAGGTAQFTVKLTSQPTASVSFTLFSNNTNEGTVSPTSLTFTAANWNTAQTVTVTGVDDAIQDGDILYTIVTNPASSSDPVYNNLNPPDVTVTNKDNDTAGITVNPTSGLTTTEAGGTAQFTVKLNTQPTASVQINLSSSNLAEGTVAPASLIFTTSNWNTAQTVTVTGVDDFVQDGNILYTINTSTAISGDTHYSGMKPADVSVTNLDNDVAGFTVTPTSGLITTEAGGTATFTVKLNSQPTVNVTIPVASNNLNEGTVSTGLLTFTTSNWNTAQTVTVTGVDDFVQDGNILYTIVLSAAGGGDAHYTGMKPSDVSVTNLDNDTAGFTVTPTAGLVTTEAGGTAQFTVKLNSQPTTNVTIPVSSSNTGEGTVSTGLLTFTTTNWNTAQTVTVTGVDDAVQDGDQPYTIILAAAGGGDLHYTGLKPSDVSVTNLDNDTAGFTVNPTTGLVTTEAGGTAQFTVKLNTQPTANVQINLSSSNTAEGTVSPSSLTFTTANWNTAQTVTVTGVDDFVVDGDKPYTINTSTATSTDTHYNGLKPSDVSVTNLDNDVAGFTVTPTSGLITTEAGGTATFTVKLKTQPSGDVTIPVSSSAPTEGTVSTPSLVFTTANWNTAQTVTVTGVHDFKVDGNVGYSVILAAASSSDTLYNLLKPSDVTLTNNDIDVAGITVTPTSGLVTTEAGDTATFTVKLNTIPSASVTINLSSSKPTEGTVSPLFVTFDSTNWNTAQTVTVTGVSDGVQDGDQAYTIVTAAATSGDAHYNGINPPDVSVTNIDIDTAGITVSPTAGLITTEAGGTAQFTVKLNTQPTADVTINLSSSNPLEGTVLPLSLTFTSVNWNTAQTVTVTGVDDNVADGNVGYTIITAPASSSDTNYNGLDPSDVSVVNLDNDVAGYIVTPTSGLVTTEAGGTAQFTVRLTSQPTVSITIPVASNTPTEGTASTALLTFTTANWATPQTVTVTGVDDAVQDGDKPYTIVLSAPGGVDPQYASLKPPDVSVTNLDNDTAGITVSPTSGLVTTEAGGTAQFTVKLTSQPTGSVTIGLSSSNSAEGTVSPASLTFTTANWSTAQTVTVTGVDDAVQDGDKPYTIITAPATSTDPNYNGRDAADVSVTNLDNDTAGFTVTPTSGLVTTEAGGTAQFTVKLNSQPTASVQVNLSSNTPTEGTAAPGVLTFTALNWSTAQTVTVTGVDDAVQDGDKLYTIVLAAAISADTHYNTLKPSDVTVTNLDNDIAGYVVTPTSGLVTTEAGGTAQFTVKLTSQPTVSITIPIASNTPTEGTVSPTTLTFTTANWNTAQTVTVTGVDDAVQDGDKPYTIVLSAPGGTDPHYAALKPSDVSATNLDNDTAGFIVTPTSGLQTTEAGGTAQFTVKLTAQPTADVTIGVSSNNTGEGTVAPAALTFTTANWSTAQTVTITGVDDAIQDGDKPYTIVLAAAVSTDTHYGGAKPPDVSVTNLDNDTAGITVNPTSGLVTTESGGTATFTVKLNSQPTAGVTITLFSNNTNEGTVSPTTLNFTAANWNTAQTVTVTGVDDFVQDGNIAYTIITNPASSADPNYNNLNPADVSVTNNDNDIAGFTVTPTSGLVTTESGGTATFTVKLNTQPTANVSINVSSNTPTEGTAAPGVLTFTSVNWNVPQTVVVTGVDDAVVDGDKPYTIVLAAAVSTDVHYGGLKPSDVAALNLDNDSVGITVTPTSGLVTTEAGGTATFTVKLNTQPTASVQITLASNNPAEGVAAPGTLTFTTANWNTAQTVTVTGVDDFVQDGNVLYTIVTNAATSADPNYNGINPPDVTVTNMDNDTAGVTVNPTAGLITTESGGTAQFTVKLTSQPTANVTFSVASNTPTEGTASPSSLTFTAANWNIAQTVTVTGVDDFVVDGNVAYLIQMGAAVSTDGKYTGMKPPDVSVTNQDNDSAGFVVTPTSGLITTESGGTAQFTVKLTSQPTASVQINVSSNTPTEGTAAPGILTFTTANWNTAQTVTVTGVDDFVVDGNVAYTVVLAAATSADTHYNGLKPSDVSVTNNDNDTAGFVVTPTSGLVTTESGGTATFTVKLTSQPTASVSFNLSSSNLAEGTVAPPSLTFTTVNWSVAQTVTVTGVDDFVVDGNVAYTIVLAAATSTDVHYSGLKPSDVSVTNNDNDTAGITVTPTSGLVTTESGGTAQFTVKLTSQPAANVTIGLSSSNTGEGTVSPISLTFTPANWSTAQTVTVTGVDDNVVDGNILYTIVTAPAVSTDPNYNGRDAADVSVTNLDNDNVGITVSPTAGLVTTESGGTATFTVKLNSQPTADVTIGLSSSNTAEGTVSPSSLTFTAANWSTSQTVTVTGVDDFVQDGNVAYTIITAPAVSTDTNYNGINPPDVSVTNNDNDTAGYVVTPTSGLVTTESGGTATFTVKLTSQPTANVVINLSSSNTAEGTVLPAALTFTVGNWNVAQTVTVTGVDDFVIDGNIAYTIVLAAAVSTDVHYSGLKPPDVACTNNDNDSAGITVSPTSGLVTTESGGTATFTVKLNTVPTATVTIGLSSSNTSEGTVSPAVLIFTTANALIPQTVTVTGVDDNVVDGNVAYTIITAPATSTDPLYNGINPPDVSVTNQDNDSAGITVQPTLGLVTTESGGTATFTVRLNSQPTAIVTIGLSSSNTAEGTVSPSSLSFTPANWNLAQTVTVTGVDDQVIDGNVVYTIITAPAVSTDTNYNGLNPPDVQVTNMDNDVAGITVSPTIGLQTTEAGGTAQFTVVLNSVPTGNVTINLSSSNTAEGTVSPGVLTFTPGNALTPQTVTITGVDDTVADGDQVYSIITSPAVSTDPNYNGFDPPDVSVTNKDNDVVGFAVTPTKGLFTNEYGGTTHFTVALKSTPSANVTIGLTSSNTAEGTVSPATLTFTPANALTPQTVTVTGVDDGVPDGNVTYTIITAPAVSADATYNGLNPPDVTVINLDNDGPAITVTPTSGLITTESGGTDTFVVVLNTVPTGNVTINLTSSKPTEGTVSPTQLVFTPANALIPQTVTVTGVDDAVSDGDQAYVIVTSPAISTDPAYNNLNPPDVSVVNQDNEPFVPPRISLSAVGMSFSASQGGSNPSSQSMSITNTGNGTLNWSLTVDQPWLTINPTSGSVDYGILDFMTVSADITGLPSGVYNAIITITDPAASNSPQTLGVTLTILPPPPTPTITNPATPVSNTLSSPALISGTSSPGATSVTWANLTTGQSGVATGTDNWVASVPLVGGDNVITIYSWNSGGAGSSTITVHFTTDTTPPLVDITFPSTALNFSASTTPVVLAGSASDDTSLASVMWYNLTTGTSGNTTGTTSWIANVPLTNGSNDVKLVATDDAGNSASKTVTIDYTSPPDSAPPIIVIVVPNTPLFGATVTPLAVAGTANDSVGVSLVTWYNQTTGGRGVALGTTSWTADVPLASGGNFIAITAEDPSGNKSTATLLVSYHTTITDNVAPFLQIQQPTTLSVLNSAATPIDVAGVAADDVALNTVVWQNPATGLSGTANGLATWSATMDLKPGANLISMTAYDTSGNLTTKQLAVSYTPPPPPPPPPVHIPAGYKCGLTGLEFLIPVVLLWGARRARRREGR
jgi:hypothetical protein